MARTVALRKATSVGEPARAAAWDLVHERLAPEDARTRAWLDRWCEREREGREDRRREREGR